MLHQPQAESMRHRRCYIRILTAALCLLQAGLLSAQEAYVKGRVSNANDDLPSATVTVGSKTVLTNSNGEFLFPIKAGTYILTVSHAGYKKIEQKVNIEPGSTNSLNFIMIPIDQMDEVVVLGSIHSNIERSNLNTAVPVDVFPEKKLLQTGQQGLIQSLNYLVPSLNAGRQDLNEPVTLRGLDPNHILILINGIRYHNSAFLNNGTPKFSLGRGSVTNDLNSIPFPAIEKVELLRDGASAQFGSDAIAGVVNIELKKSSTNTSIRSHIGQYYAGDGLKFSIGVNKGFTLNKKGFLNFSFDIRQQSPTTRAGEYQNTVYLNYPSGANPATIKAKDDSMINERGIDKKEFSKYNGINQLISTGMLVNGVYPTGKNSELFFTGSVNYRENHLAASYRFPKNTNQVNLALFPDGFRPDVKTDNWDITAIAGLRGETKNKWHWNFSNSFGRNTNKRYVSNSNNASQQFLLGKNAPTEFYLGKLIYNQYINNITFTKDFARPHGKLNICNLSMGAEWRIENYEQEAGDEASWKKYDNSINIQGGAQPSIGSLNQDLNKNRTVSGAYIDFETETNNRLLVNIASRYEFYDDFGGNLAGKLAVRYKFTEKFSLRGSVSNGFRAPSMQQRFFEGTQSFRGSDRTSGIFNNVSAVTKAFDIPLLEAEKSVNLSGGFTSRFSNFISLTVDAYWIQIRNRIVLSGVFDRRIDPYVDTILVNYPNIEVVQFYVDAINTRTFGVDAIINGWWHFNKTKFAVTLAANFNRNSIFGKIKTPDHITNVSRYTNTIFGIEEKTTMEKDQPDKKIILSATVSKGKFEFVFRNTFFGNTATREIVTSPPRDTLYQSFSSKIITDFNINYSPSSWLTITIGGNNIFDVYPDRLKYFRINTGGISLYSNGPSPFGSNGGYYYVSMSVNFLSKNKKASQ